MLCLKIWDTKKSEPRFRDGAQLIFSDQHVGFDQILLAPPGQKPILKVTFAIPSPHSVAGNPNIIFLYSKKTLTEISKIDIDNKTGRWYIIDNQY